MARFRDTAKKYNLTLNESKTVSSITAINILGYCVGHSLIKPDPHQLQALMELPPPSSPKGLQCTIGLFAYYSKLIPKFSYKIKPLPDCKVFPTEGQVLPAFEKLEKELGEVALHRVSHSGGHGGCPPSYNFFETPPPTKTNAPHEANPPFKNGAPHLKNKPPSSLKHETPFQVP